MHCKVILKNFRF